MHKHPYGTADYYTHKLENPNTPKGEVLSIIGRMERTAKAKGRVALKKVFDATPGVKIEGNKEAKAFLEEWDSAIDEAAQKAIEAYVNGRNPKVYGQQKTTLNRKVPTSIALFGLCATTDKVFSMALDVSTAKLSKPGTWVKSLADNTGRDIDDPTARDVAIKEIMHWAAQNDRTSKGFDPRVQMNA